MTIIVAPDSFKGSLTSIQATKVMEHAIQRVNPTINIIRKPMADGGEGTLDCLLYEDAGEKIPVTCTGPLGEQIYTYYGVLPDRTVVIEIAKIVGLALLSKERRHPNHTTSYGIGEVIIHAIERGYDSFLICLGGSATNDGGLGMLQALGMKATDGTGEIVGMSGHDLLQVQDIDFTHFDDRLKKIKINIAADVENPLCGAHGATYIYGKQKGLRREQMKQYDDALSSYGKIIENKLQCSFMTHKGAGAAGGLGFSFLAIGGHMASGAEIVAKYVGLEEAIRHARIVMTGEGSSDNQTLYGKAPSFVAQLARKWDVPVILLSGKVSRDRTKLSDVFTGSFSIINEPMTEAESMESVEVLLYEQTKQIVQFFQSITRK